jgi:hypothetical protein
VNCWLGPGLRFGRSLPMSKKKGGCKKKQEKEHIYNRS